MQKYNHQDIIHRLLTVKTEYMSTDQTIRIKQSLLASTKHFSKAPFSLFPLLRYLPLSFQFIHS